jgi:hypothetical protein
VFLSYSDDTGATWKQVPISTAAGVVEFLPDLDVGPDGTLAVQYYRGIPGTTTHPVTHLTIPTTFVDTYVVISDTDGDSFGSPFRVSDQTTDWATAFSNIAPNFGDYNTVVVTRDDVLASWAGGDEIVVISGLPRHVPSAIFGHVEIKHLREGHKDRD